jgi:hypothetical protein
MKGAFDMTDDHNTHPDSPRLSDAELRALAASLRADVVGLCLPEGRVVGSSGHDEARRFLLRRIDELGLEHYDGRYEHPYDCGEFELANVLATIPGRDRDLPPIIIGAHYDSVIPAPCADDNGAAVAIALALAGRISAGELPRDVVLGFFDGEEPPYYLSPAMGSVRFYEDQMDDRGVHAAVVMDLVGHDVPVEQINPLGFAVPGTGRLRDLLVMTGAESHPALEGVVRRVETPDRLRLVATVNDNVGDMSDHAVFRWNREPFLFFSCGRWQHYHEPTDTPDRLNYEKMARTTAYLQALLRPLAEADLARRPIESELADTTRLEIETLESTFGPLMPLVRRAAGVGRLRTREELGRVVDLIRRMGL